MLKQGACRVSFAPVNEIRCPIDWIDNPCRVVSEDALLAVCCRFLTNKTAIEHNEPKRLIGSKVLAVGRFECFTCEMETLSESWK